MQNAIASSRKQSVQPTKGGQRNAVLFLGSSFFRGLDQKNLVRITANLSESTIHQIEYFQSQEGIKKFGPALNQLLLRARGEIFHCNIQATLPELLSISDSPRPFRRKTVMVDQGTRLFLKRLSTMLKSTSMSMLIRKLVSSIVPEVINAENATLDLVVRELIETRCEYETIRALAEQSLDSKDLPPRYKPKVLPDFVFCMHNNAVDPPKPAYSEFPPVPGAPKRVILRFSAYPTHAAFVSRYESPNSPRGNNK